MTQLSIRNTRPSDLETPRAFEPAASPAPGRDLRAQVGFESASDRRKVLEWLGRGLRPDRLGRLPAEYPILFDRNASVFHLTIFENRDPAAFATLWAVNIRVGVHRLRVGLVSLVYTDPDFRGKGYGSRVVDDAVELAGRLNLGFVLLWSELGSFYSRLGFERSGCESLLLLDPVSIGSAILEVGPGTPAGEFVVDRPGDRDWYSIERIRDQRECQLELNRDEFQSLRSIPDMSVRVARDAQGIQAFAIRGRGDDLQEVIHEWGGAPRAILECCRSLTEDSEPHREAFLLCPPERLAVPWSLRRNGARLIRKPLAWSRISSLTSLADDLSRLLPGESKIRLRAAKAVPGVGSEVILSSNGNEVQIPPQDLLRLFLGSDDPSHDRERCRTLSSVLDESVLDRLPLPFFLWGLESI